jgi:hypothetical protein
MDQGSAQQQALVTVQDASNQTDTPPVSEDENCCESVPLQEKLHPHDLQVSSTDSKMFSFLGLIEYQALRIQELHCGV